MSIIEAIESVLDARTRLRRDVAGYALAGVGEGLSIACLIPLLRNLVEDDLHAALLWLGAAFLAFVFSAAVLMRTGLAAQRTGVLVVSEGITKRLANHVARLPLGWFTAGRAGQFTNLVKSAEDVGNFPAMVLQQTTLALSVPTTVIVFVFVLEWRLGVAFLVMVPLGWWAYRRILAAQAPARAAEAAALDEVSARVLEFAQAQPVLRAAGVTSDRLARLDDALSADRATTVRTLNATGLPLLTHVAVVQVGVVVATAATVAMTFAGWVDVPAAIALLILVVQFAQPLELVGPYGTGIALGHAGLAGLREVIDTPALPEPENVTARPADARLTFEAVRFGYAGDRPVLDGLDLDLRPGTVTALVGPSGAGKSTVLRLAARFFDVDAGAVRLGGVDVRDLSTRTLMAQLGLVFQHVYLFDTTIEENVRLARPDASEADVRAAARAARLDEVVARLPDGWATTVGEGGERLSGGERQRVSIARAILKDAPILLLDEVTAALDAENEAAITAAITELARTKTVLVVAHRLSTIASADRIAFLEGGRVVESGTHRELLERGGRYADFWRVRSAASRWRVGR